MTHFKSPFLQELHDRGFIHQCTHLDELDQLTSTEKISLYIGFDATAKSLHVGNLMGVMMLRIAQKHGHKPIVLMGGGTTKVGDPSGKDKSRPVITDEMIQGNIDSIKGVFEKYITFGSDKSDAIMVNNDDWLSSLNYMRFLRDYGRHFSINRMMSFDSVKLRLDREQPLSFLEFNYMILQSYDFLELYRQHNCCLQAGGSDQWGNIVNGVELIRRIEGKSAFGLTAPLISTASGQKMGKSENGAIWLNAAQLAPFDYWQYWRNTEDADTFRFLKFYTDLSVEEIEAHKDLTGSELNDLKIRLADEATRMVHGEQAVKDIHQSIAQTFGGAQTDIKVTDTDEAGNLILDSALPIIDVAKKDLEEGIPAFLLVGNSGLVKSNGEARRLIRGKGCKLNDQTLEDENAVITTDNLMDPGVLKLSVGKKKHTLIRPVN